MSADCDIHRTAHIEATLDCGPSSDSLSRQLGELRCRGSGFAQYEYSLLLDGGAEKLTGTGTYRGELAGFLHLTGAPGYDFTLNVPVTGTYGGERATQRSGGLDARTLSVSLSSREDGPSEAIRFDGDQKPSIEGSDCTAGSLAGRRHLTLTLDSRPGDTTTLAPDLPAVPTLRTVAPTVVRPAPSFLSSRPPLARTDVAVGAQPVGVAVNVTNDRVYVANAGAGSISVVDGSVGRVVGTITGGTRPESVAVNPKTNHVYVGNSTSSTVSVIDGATDEVVVTIRVRSRPSGIAV
ncbi:MAG TPA: YncE family protein, partial [Candidatus Limnocylindria bacterium]|nr:YncE family protein [Candidatus Limnocylindria bacterium]